MPSIDKTPVEEHGRAILEIKRNETGLKLLDAEHAKQVSELRTAIEDETQGGKETQKNKRALAKLLLARPSLLVEDILKRTRKKLEP